MAPSPVHVERAIDRGLAWLAAAQAPDGELPSVVATAPDMGGVRAPDTNTFTTPQGLWSLSFVDHPVAEQVRQRGATFVADCCEDGAWRFFTRKVLRRIDPDSDCTGCAAAALRAVGQPVDEDAVRAVLAAHRDQEGRFLTWFRAPGRVNDVDSVANANVLWFLGDDPLGAAAAGWLCQLVVEAQEEGTFPYYETPLALFHAVSRAWCAGAAGLGAAAAVLGRRVYTHRHDDGSWGNALDTAFAALTLLNTGAAPDAKTLAWLCDAQGAEGSWPDCAAFNGPEWPAPRSMWWGGPAWTTALVIEVLARA